MHETWHLQRSKGFLDALIDIGRDLDQCGQIDHFAVDNDGSRQAIIESVEARIGKPSDVGDLEKTPIAFQKYWDTHGGENWLEGRLDGYTHTLRMLCHLDCGSGSGKALIQVSRWFESEYGVENTIADGGMESLVDMIADTIGSPPDAAEGYADGHKNMMRLVEHLAYMNGI